MMPQEAVKFLQNKSTPLGFTESESEDIEGFRKILESARKKVPFKTITVSE